ncbi:MAG: hypothetical protein IT430_04005 [Phycisphaerales bacterium]|nr:hypothetical protein [Phycisphaerales bacterium]
MKRNEQDERALHGLLNTSVDDCRSHIDNMDDIEFLQRLWGACQARGHKTRATIVRRRINKLLDAKRGKA